MQYHQKSVSRAGKQNNTWPDAQVIALTIACAFACDWWGRWTKFSNRSKLEIKQNIYSQAEGPYNANPCWHWNLYGALQQEGRNIVYRACYSIVNASCCRKQPKLKLNDIGLAWDNAFSGFLSLLASGSFYREKFRCNTWKKYTVKHTSKHTRDWNVIIFPFDSGYSLQFNNASKLS